PLLHHPARAEAQCIGDCNADSEVTVNELIIGVNIALENVLLGVCPTFDSNHDGIITVNELISAVNAALNGCTGSTPTPIASATPIRTATATATPTSTFTPVLTATPTTPAGNQSVCGGPVTSVPKLCNITIMPNPVRPGDDATITLSGSD